MNYIVILLYIIAIGILLAVLRYIMLEKDNRELSYGQLLIEILSAKGYKKASMPNEFPTYSGELEEKDTKEYVAFISPDILKLIK